ncbi:hypothetical protein T01_8997, partial [Trichinella spiralis]
MQAHSKICTERLINTQHTPFSTASLRSQKDLDGKALSSIKYNLATVLQSIIFNAIRQRLREFVGLKRNLIAHQVQFHGQLFNVSSSEHVMCFSLSYSYKPSLKAIVGEHCRTVADDLLFHWKVGCASMKQMCNTLFIASPWKNARVKLSQLIKKDMADKQEMYPLQLVADESKQLGTESKRYDLQLIFSQDFL